MQIIKLVTGNEEKVKAANQFLRKYNISVEQAKIKLIEPQEESVEKIALYKADQAFKILLSPVVVMDTGWNIPSLNGFPGPYMHSIMNWFTLEDFQNLLKVKTDKRIFMENYACYKDSKLTKIFTRKLIGIFVDQPKGEGNIIDVIVSFRRDLKTIAECHDLDIPTTDENADSSQWEKLGKWLSENES